MKTEDEYKTIRSRSTGLFKDRGSKFIAISAPVDSSEEALSFIDGIRKEYHDARHHCFAYKIGPGENEWRVNDDGEPSGSAGNPILGQIRSFEITNVVIVVVRYFGGTLLGVGGLINAYRSAARNALESAVFITRQITELYTINFPYSMMNSIMTIIKENNIEQVNQKFELECIMVIRIRRSLVKTLTDYLKLMDGVVFKPCLIDITGFDF